MREMFDTIKTTRLKNLVDKAPLAAAVMASEPTSTPTSTLPPPPPKPDDLPLVAEQAARNTLRRNILRRGILSTFRTKGGQRGDTSAASVARPSLIGGSTKLLGQ